MRRIPGLMACIGAAIASLVSVAADAREIVGFAGFPAGTIVVKTSERRLYFVLADGHALTLDLGG